MAISGSFAGCATYVRPNGATQRDAKRSGTVAIMSVSRSRWPMATKCGTRSRIRRRMPATSSSPSTRLCPVPAATTTTWSAAQNSASETWRLSSAWPWRNMHT